MGQKISPIGLRVGITHDWSSRWVAKKADFPIWIKEDYRVRRALRERLLSSAIGKIDIERSDGNIKIIINSARPGSVLGQNAKNLESINLLIKKTIKKRNIKIIIDVVEVADFALDPTIVAQDIARRIEQREGYRFVQKSALSAAQRRGATGARITIGGRLNGADISRKQTIGFGKLPLSKLSSKIEYGFATAKTTHGQLGIKVWIY